MKREKISESSSIRRHMKTYAELEDGTLVEYDLSPGYSDEYGSWVDDKAYNWLKIQKRIEETSGKKIVASIAKIWEKTIEHKTYTKGPDITIRETIETNRKELMLRRQDKVRIESQHDWTPVYCTSNDPDKTYKHDYAYLKHFGLKKDKLGNIVE